MHAKGDSHRCLTLPISAIAATLPVSAWSCHLSGHFHYGHVSLKDLWFFLCVCMFHFLTMGKDDSLPPSACIQEDLQAW